MSIVCNSLMLRCIMYIYWAYCILNETGQSIRDRNFIFADMSLSA